MTGQDVCHLSRGWDLDQPHLTVLDDFVDEVLPEIDVLGTFPSADDAVTPRDARCVVLVYRGRLLLLKTKTQAVQKRPEIQHLTASHRC